MNSSQPGAQDCPDTAACDSACCRAVAARPATSPGSGEATQNPAVSTFVEWRNFTSKNEALNNQEVYLNNTSKLIYFPIIRSFW